MTKEKFVKRELTFEAWLRLQPDIDMAMVLPAKRWREVCIKMIMGDRQFTTRRKPKRIRELIAKERYTTNLRTRWRKETRLIEVWVDL